MAKFVHDDVIDAALAVIQTADKETICETQPTTYTEATSNKGVAGFVLGTKATPTFTGPAAGDTSGRKITVDQATGVAIDVSGNADHIALVDDGLSKLLAVTTFTLQAVTAGNTATINAYKYEIQDPT